MLSSWLLKDTRGENSIIPSYQPTQRNHSSDERETERFFLLLFGEVKVRRVFPPPYSFSPSLKQKKLLIRLFGFNLNIAGDSDWTTNTCKSALRLIHHLSERHAKTEQDKKEERRHQKSFIFFLSTNVWRSWGSVVVSQSRFTSVLKKIVWSPFWWSRKKDQKTTFEEKGVFSWLCHSADFWSERGSLSLLLSFAV